MTERAERERISHQASESLFRMPHDDLQALLALKGGEDWLLADLTVGDLRRAYRRRAVRDDDRVLDGLRAWGTADAPRRLHVDEHTERAVDNLRTVVDPLTDYTVRALAGRLYANPAPSYLEVGRVIDHALALREVGARYGERGIAAARFATWDYVEVGEFERRMAVFAEFIEAGLPDWVRPLIGL